MPTYEFQCSSCPGAEAKADVHFERDYPMKEAPPLDSKIKCPVCGRQTAKRIISSGIMGTVKATEYDWKPGETVRTKVDGQEINFSFVDHPHTDPTYQRNLHELAGRNSISGDASGLKNVRYDEKHGRMVVDVLSDVPDPLGKIEANKRAGKYAEPKVRKVNQNYRVRPKKKK